MTNSNKPLASLFVGAAMFAATQSASAQSVFSDNFETGYTYNASLSGQNGWLTNDPYTGGTFNGGDIGQSDAVGIVPGFRTTTNDHSAYLGGAGAGQGGVYPGSPATRLNHNFNLGSAATLAFNVDFAVTASDSLTPHDTFGFNFRDGSTGTIPLFSINFSVPTNNSNTFDNIGYTAGVSTPAPQNSFQLGLRYHLTVNVNVTAKTFSASFFRQLANGTSAGEGVFVIANNVAYTGNISNIAAAWNLADQSRDAASGAYTNPGSNILLFDNLSVAVPEPSTYALLGLGLVGLAMYGRSRRAARV